MPPISPLDHRPRRLKLPQGNGLVLAVLRSPIHRLLSGMVVELRYTGRRSGREYILPVQYARAGERLVVKPQAANTTTWWRNFRSPSPVTVRLAGRIRHGTALVVAPREPRWNEARELYGFRWRRSLKDMAGPLLTVTLDPDGSQDPGGALDVVASQPAGPPPTSVERGLSARTGSISIA